MESLIDRINQLAACAGDLNFSILGAVYLYPGRFLRLSGLQYALVMLGGVLWIGVGAVAAWKLFRPRLTAAMKRGDAAVSRELFAAFSLIYVLSGLYVTLSYPPTTDEPHYLTIAESILKDGDIMVANNYEARDYTAFFPSAEIDPHAVITPDGRMYSQHTLGLPVLVLPFYALAGRWGVSVLLSVLAAAFAAWVYLLCRKEGIRKESCAVTAVLTGITCPLYFASNLVFTEVPAAVLSAAALLNMGSPWIPAAAGSALPWLHPRYALIALGIAFLSWLRAKDRVRLAATWLVCGTISGLAFFTIYRGEALASVLNVLTEQYPARLESLTAGVLAGVSLGNPIVGLLGKLFDREFGVIPYSPWLLVLFAGLGALSGGKFGRHRIFLWGVGAYLLATSAFRNWGGSAFPGRTLIPVLPFIMPYVALGVDWASEKAWRRKVLGALASVSVFMSIMMTVCPVLRYTSGRDWMAAKLGSFWSVMPFNWFPSFSRNALLSSLIGATIVSVVVMAVRAGEQKR